PRSSSVRSRPRCSSCRPRSRPSSPDRRMTRRARVVSASVIVALGVALGLRAWLLRDPTAHFDQRRGRILAVERESDVDSLGTRETHLRVTSTSQLRVELAIRRPSYTAEDSGQVRRPLFLILGG